MDTLLILRRKLADFTVAYRSVFDNEIKNTSGLVPVQVPGQGTRYRAWIGGGAWKHETVSENPTLAIESVVNAAVELVRSRELRRNETYPEFHRTKDALLQACKDSPFAATVLPANFTLTDASKTKPSAAVSVPTVSVPEATNPDLHPRTGQVLVQLSYPSPVLNLPVIPPVPEQNAKEITMPKKPYGPEEKRANLAKARAARVEKNAVKPAVAPEPPPPPPPPAPAPKAGSSVYTYSKDGPELPYTTKTQWITPKVAANLLKKGHDRQRKINTAAVTRYAEAMKSNNWELTHSNPIAFQDGKLIDGQHRLSAVIEADVSLWMVVAEYSPDATIRGVDRAVPRTLADVLTFSGELEALRAKKAAALARSLFALANDTTRQINLDHDITLTLRANKTAILSVLEGATKKSIKAPILAAFVYVYDLDPVKVMEILRRVIEGDALAKNTGAWHLRRILDGETNTSISAYSYSEQGVRALKCLSLELKGEVLTMLKHRTAGSEPDALVWARKAREKAGLFPRAYPAQDESKAAE